jgi:Flp pilus assembly pilin Flp
MNDKLLSLYVVASLKIQNLKDKAKKVIHNQTGASTVEYALLTGVVAVGVIGAATAMFPELKSFFLETVKTVSAKLSGK